ncbi:MAG: hypothetical protein P1U56_00270 [Saprospiraceae bacterium]|nr:hypothetical protein [Saprospiraceae bacterium]
MKNKPNIEIKDIAPTLFSMDKKNPFKVPHGYFSELEEKIYSSVDVSEKITNDLPEGYFENLSNQVVSRAKEKRQSRIIHFFSKRRLSIAASFLFLFCASYFFISQSNTVQPENEIAFEMEEVEEALDYLIENDHLYLSDLISLDYLTEAEFEDGNDLDEIEDSEWEDLLEEIDPEDLEELL